MSDPPPAPSDFVPGATSRVAHTPACGLVAAGRGRHVERLMGPFLVEPVHKGIEARLLLERIGRPGADRISTKRLGRGHMSTETLTTPAEAFTISIRAEDEQHGALSME